MGHHCIQLLNLPASCYYDLLLSAVISYLLPLIVLFHLAIIIVVIFIIIVMVILFFLHAFKAQKFLLRLVRIPLLTAEFFFTEIFTTMAWFVLSLPNLILPWDLTCAANTMNPSLVSNCSPWIPVDQLGGWLCWFYISGSIRYFIFWSH